MVDGDECSALRGNAELVRISFEASTMWLDPMGNLVGGVEL